MSRRQLTDWFASEGYACCAGGSKAAATGAGGGAAAPGTAGVSPGAGTGSGSEAGGSGRLAMWVDRYSERQLAPGLWLARWMELYQPFVGESRPPAAAVTGASGPQPFRAHESRAWRAVVSWNVHAGRASTVPGQHYMAFAACPLRLCPPPPPQPASTRRASAPPSGPARCCGSRTGTRTALRTCMRARCRGSRRALEERPRRPPWAKRF